ARSCPSQWGPSLSSRRCRRRTRTAPPRSASPMRPGPAGARRPRPARPPTPSPNGCGRPPTAWPHWWLRRRRCAPNGPGHRRGPGGPTSSPPSSPSSATAPAEQLWPARRHQGRSRGLAARADQRTRRSAPGGPARFLVVLVRVVEVLRVRIVRVRVLVVGRPLPVARKLPLKCFQVGLGGLVLQLPGHLCLLGLRTAAPHGDPLANNSGRLNGPDDVRNLS